LKNMTLAGLKNLSGRFVTNEHAETAASERAMKEFSVKAGSVFNIVGTLSGGNQQKVVLAKWLLTKPRVLFLDEPTRGIDVGAKQEIYAHVNNLARAGLAIVLVSSELPEILGLSDRVLVLHEGRVTGEFQRADATAERVMACATGHTQRGLYVLQHGLAVLNRWFEERADMNQQTNDPVTEHTPAAAEPLQTKWFGTLKIPTSALRAYTMVLALIVVWLLFTWATGGVFLEARNFSNLMRQTAVTGVLAVGMLMVIVTGQIDLSVGSVAGLTSGIAAMLLTARLRT
jgi:energy-coupling factor transporter ATP-binding protein EcfA2